MNKKLYTSYFKLQGGQCGEIDHDLEARFELTDEEVKEAIEVLQEDDHLSSSLPEAMHEAIWEAAEEQLFEDAAKYDLGDLDDLNYLIPGWEDKTTEELVEEIRNSVTIQNRLFAMDAVPGLVFDISYPEEVTDSE